MAKLNKAVIIGGTSGIGLTTAHYLVRKNYDVIIAGRRELNIDGIENYYVDVRDEGSLAIFFDSLLQKHGKINSLIYASGISSSPINIQDFDKNSWNEIFSTNVTGAMLTLKYAYPFLKENQGRVVVINSLAGRMYSRLSGFEYTVTKAALSGLVRQLAVEWAPDNVMINSVYPGMTLTPMLEEHINKTGLRVLEQKIPLGRLARPEDIAHAVEFLISPENTYMTGIGVDVCGGQFLSG